MTMFEKFKNWFFGIKNAEEITTAPYKIEAPVEPAPAPIADSSELPPETPTVTEKIKKPRGKPRGKAKKEVDNKKNVEPTKVVAKITTTRKSKKTQL